MVDASLDSIKPNLQRLYTEDPVARAVFDWLAGREPLGKETDAEELANGAGAEYGDVINLMKTGLTQSGAGHFLVGRRGKNSRFAWNIEPVEAAAAGRGDVPRPSPASAQMTPDKGCLSHSFNLRPGMVISIQLPVDLTRKEATRLSQWIESLPFDDA